MSISITIHAESGAEARAQMRELLGGGPASVQPKVDVRELAAAIAAAPPAVLEVNNDAGQEDVENPKLMHPVPRERGKPSFGHARRTKAEIAEDDAADKADKAVTIASMKTLPDDATAAEVAEAAAISTGDERVGPEDDVATVEQDEADEASETEAAVEDRPADKKLTHDDVRNSLGAYVKLYGMAAAQEDGPKVIALALKNPEIVKVSAIPETQEALGAVVAGIDEMTDKNPFKRAKVA